MNMIYSFFKNILKEEIYLIFGTLLPNLIASLKKLWKVGKSI
jgi:hypothetical protein